MIHQRKAINMSRTVKLSAYAKSLEHQVAILEDSLRIASDDLIFRELKITDLKKLVLSLREELESAKKPKGKSKKK